MNDEWNTVPGYGEWRTIPGYGGRYMINRVGDVVSVLGRFGGRTTPKLLKKHIRSKSVCVYLMADGDKPRQRCVMRLMMAAWDCELSKSEVAYPIDGDYANTSLENIGVRKRSEDMTLPILKVDLDGNVVARYQNIEDAAEQEFVSEGCIRYHLHGMARKPFLGAYHLVRERDAVWAK